MSWEQNLKSEPYGMGIHTHNAHSGWIDRFEVDYPGFKGYDRPGGKTNVEIAGEIYHYFHTHYYKLLATFLRDCPKHTTIANFTNYENVVIVDIGSGVGTTAYSLLDVYSEIGTALKRLHIIFIEPCNIRLKFRNIGLSDYVINRYPELSVTTSSITAEYPDCQEAIFQELKSFQGFNLIVIMSNILSWVDDISATASKVSELVIQSPQHEVALVNIEPNNYGDNLLTFYSKLNNCLERILPAGKRDVVKFKNPLKSKWWQLWRYVSYRLEYYNSIAELIAYNAKIGTFQNIVSSYHSATIAYRMGIFYDEIEMKIVAANFEDNIRDISDQIQYGYNYHNDILPYTIPKKNGETRPLAIDSFFSELVNSTLMRHWGYRIDQRFDLNGEVSFGERIADQSEITLYKNYYEQYFKRYIIIAKKYATSYSYYAKVDIKSFYKNIDQNILYSRLINYINPKDDKFIALLKNLVIRNVSESGKGKGIIQGSSISGFLANIYLTLLDYDISNAKDIAYIRYVDDIYIFSTTEDKLTKILEKVSQDLKERDLLETHDSSDPSKNDRGESTYLISTGALDEDTEMNKLSNKINGIVQSFYFINNITEQKRFIDNPEAFSLIYKECLKSIGINISQEWLIKKLQKNTIVNVFRKPFHNFKWWLNKRGVYILNWVDLPNKVEEVGNWKINFEKKNSRFFYFVEECRQELKSFANNNSNQYEECLNNPEKDTTKALRRLKFALRRLGIIFTPEASTLFRKYLDNPWILHQKFIVPYTELLPDILMDLIQTKCSYKKMRAIYILGEWRKLEVLDSLQQEYIHSLSNDNPIYNVLTTEALLKFGKKACEGVVDETKRYIEGQLEGFKKGCTLNYHKVRNALLILNLSSPDSANIYLQFETDYRMKMVNRFLKGNKGCNILEIPEVKISNTEIGYLLPILEPVYNSYSM